MIDIFPFLKIPQSLKRENDSSGKYISLTMSDLARLGSICRSATLFIFMKIQYNCTVLYTTLGEDNCTN